MIISNLKILLFDIWYMFISSPIQLNYTNSSLFPQTPTHICLIIDFCPGGELFALLDKQWPMKFLKEESARYSNYSLLYIFFLFFTFLTFPFLSFLFSFVLVSKPHLTYHLKLSDCCLLEDLELCLWYNLSTT